MRNFHNPYSFVPAPPAPTDAVTPPGLRHGLLSDHGRLEKDLLSGRIVFRFTTATPMLNVDPSRLVEHRVGGEKEDVHKIYPIRVDASGAPVVAASGVRNAIAVAYEAVTNSRLRQFDHPERLRYSERRVSVEHEQSPESLLPATHRPARSLAELSSADRLFGWSHPAGSGAWRSQVAILSVAFEHVTGPDAKISTAGAEAVRKFRRGDLPLTNLAAPKPQGGRFYVAEDENGAPQADGNRRDRAATGYRAGRGLRGRKFYWHHAAVAGDPDYWDPDANTAPANWEAREYMAPPADGGDGAARRDNRPGVVSNQNRSVRGWIVRGATFRVEFEVTNLDPVEAGALLWLLGLDSHEGGEGKPPHFLKFGGARPLGFGSVSVFLAPEETALFTGAAWRTHWRGFNAGARPPDKDRADVADLASLFREELRKIYGCTAFTDVPFVREFLAIARGPQDAYPIHYPRVDATPHPKGENFRWWQRNTDHLPAASQDSGLPLLVGAPGRGGQPGRPHGREGRGPGGRRGPR